MDLHEFNKNMKNTGFLKISDKEYKFNKKGEEVDISYYDVFFNVNSYKLMKVQDHCTCLFLKDNTPICSFILDEITQIIPIIQGRVIIRSKSHEAI